MSRRVTGTIVEKDSRIVGLRFTAEGQRRYLSLPEGTTRADAEKRLALVLAQVAVGEWKPPAPVPAIEPGKDDPLFWDFAEAWFDTNKHEWREATRLDYQWQIETHLLPFFRNLRLSEITIEKVDDFRLAKLREAAEIKAAAEKGKPITDEYTDKRGRRYVRKRKALSATSINKCLTRLSSILQSGVERESIVIERNTAAGSKRRVKSVKPRRTYMDRSEQIEALLTAAAQLDSEARPTAQLARRATLAAMVFGGLRIGELVALDWRDVDLGAGRIHVRQSKTDAGVRRVDLLPILRDELSALKALRNPTDNEPVFRSAAHTRQDRNRVRGRTLARSIKRANELLAKDELSALPDGLTPHSLRRTFASLLIALGKDPAYVMRQMGHTSPTMTLGLYAQVMDASDEDRERLRTLVEGAVLADRERLGSVVLPGKRATVLPAGM